MQIAHTSSLQYEIAEKLTGTMYLEEPTTTQLVDSAPTTMTMTTRQLYLGPPSIKPEQPQVKMRGEGFGGI
jgi:hypothetical protein